MMAFSRVVYVCKCPTGSALGGALDGLWVRAGTVADVDRLPAEISPPGRAAQLRARIEDGEILVVGEAPDGRIASCTWIRRGGSFCLHHMPGRWFRLAEGVGYGYDAWTDPALRGRGIRRAVFAEELRMLAQLGCAWEVSYFVTPQLEGGRRTLARIGAPLAELWRVTARPDGSVALAELSPDGAATPCFSFTREEVIA
jgi:GNAT superfamily N-acetyltransferase